MDLEKRRYKERAIIVVLNGLEGTSNIVAAKLLSRVPRGGAY